MSKAGWARVLGCGLILTFCGCAAFDDPYVRDGAVGGIGAAGIGAGAGALIARNMVNGDIGKSALVGGAIGLPVGIAAGVAYRSYVEQSRLDDNRARILENQEYIIGRQREIDRLRAEIDEESFAIEPDTSLRGYIYTGPTVGVANRR